MDDPSPSLLWWAALSAAVLVHAFTAFAKVAFRLAGPVTLEALVERVGAERTEFLRKSLRAPSPFWFSLHLASGAALLLVVLVLFSGRLAFGIADWMLTLAPTGEPANDVVLFALLFLAVAAIEFVLPVIAARMDRVVFIERNLPLLRLVHVVFSPLARPLARWAEDEDEAEPDEETADEDLDAYIGVGTREGILEEGEGELLRNLVEFGDTRVYEVMTPRTDVVGVAETTTVAEAVEVVARHRFSRMPVHRGHLDDIVGVVTLKDAVQALEAGRGEEAVPDIMRPAYIVPDSKKVAELLKELQAHRQQMAVVVDEYGGTAGLVTVEDLLEELVGEIREEHESEDGEDLVRESDGSWLARGRASLHDVSETIGADLENDDTATVAGLLMAECDRVPAVGDVIERDGFRFEVVQADRRRVMRVRIGPSDTTAAESRPSGR